jgi:hypothetical protein
MTAPNPQLASQRHRRGQQHLASLVTYWLQSSQWTLRQFCDIASWATGEPSINSGFLSHLSRGCFDRVSLRRLDTLATVNQAVWRWQQGSGSQPSALTQASRIKVAWLTDAIWLPRESDPKSPLDLSDFVYITAGYLSLAYVPAACLSPQEGGQLSEELSALLNRLVGSLSPRDAVAAVMETFPGSQEADRAVVRDILLGCSSVDRMRLQALLPELAVTVARLRGVESAKPYGAAELREELLAARSRT